LLVVDNTEDAVNAIFDHYEQQGFQPSPEERERLLDL